MPTPTFEQSSTMSMATDYTGEPSSSLSTFITTKHTRFSTPLLSTNAVTASSVNTFMPATTFEQSSTISMATDYTEEPSSSIDTLIPTKTTMFSSHSSLLPSSMISTAASIISSVNTFMKTMIS